MPGAGFEQDRPPAPDGLGLIALDDRAGGDGLGREQVGRTDQDADLDPSLRRLAASVATNRALRASWMPPGEDEVEVARRCPGRDRPIDHVEGLFPQHEARPGADVPAALAAFEDEPPRTVADELVHQAGRRDVQIGHDPGLLQLAGLVGPAPGDQGERRAGGQHGGHLLAAQFGRNEPKQADPPGLAGQALRGSLEKRLDLAPRSIASARNGSAPPSATAAANSTTSLTRVIGPCRIG